ncbi:MAG TPA: hypothetical protein VLJ84_05970 [Usitatibacter sp.]|nr:hypothetical protein [Usitatibacter sp.]
MLAHAAAPVTRPPELPVAVDGAAVAIRGAAPGRAASLSFSAHAHDRIVIAISALKMEPASGSALLIGVRDAQDRPVTSEPARCFTAGTLDAGDTCTAIVEILSGGRHILELEPPFSAAASYSVKLSTQRIATLGIGAPAIEFATTKPMETIEFELDVPAGRSVMIAVDGLKHTPDIDSNSQLGVWAADGNRIAGYGCRTRPIEGLAVPPGPCRTKVPAPASDTHYQVRFKGPAGATASGYLTAAEVKP